MRRDVEKARVASLGTTGYNSRDVTLSRDGTPRQTTFLRRMPEAESSSVALPPNSWGRLSPVG